MTVKSFFTDMVENIPFLTFHLKCYPFELYPINFDILREVYIYGQFFYSLSVLSRHLSDFGELGIRFINFIL